MLSINGAQFLNITYLLAALFAAFCAAVFLTIVPLASIHVLL